MTQDVEITAIEKIVDASEPLDSDIRKRILELALDHYVKDCYLLQKIKLAEMRRRMAIMRYEIFLRTGKVIRPEKERGTIDCS